MSKINKYTYLVTMPARFTYSDGHTDPYDVDFISNPTGADEEDILNCFTSIYGQGMYSQSGRFKRLNRIKRLIVVYNYKLIEGVSDRLYTKKENNTVCLEIIIKTDALGSHLACILEDIDSDLEYGEREFSTWVRGAMVKRQKWQKIDANKLVDCDHTKSKRLEIMKDKDGSIVEVRECSKCKQLFKRHIY